jgi:HEAT repeat protein
MEAVLALADFTDEAPVQALEIALSDPSPDVRYEALDVLSDIETPEAYQAIKRALDDPDDDVRELAELLSELYADEDYAQ